MIPGEKWLQQVNVSGRVWFKIWHSVKRSCIFSSLKVLTCVLDFPPQEHSSPIEVIFKLIQAGHCSKGCQTPNGRIFDILHVKCRNQINIFARREGELLKGALE